MPAASWCALPVRPPSSLGSGAAWGSMMLGVYLAVYVATSWHMNDLIHASASRLLLHLIGPAIFILAVAVGDHFPVRAKSMNPLSTSTDSSLT